MITCTLSPTIKQAQLLLDVCSQYGENWKIKFNPNKSKVIGFGKKNIQKNQSKSE